jgi:hypothetical protein
LYGVSKDLQGKSNYETTDFGPISLTTITDDKGNVLGYSIGANAPVPGYSKGSTDTTILTEKSSTAGKETVRQGFSDYMDPKKARKLADQ